MGFLDFASKSKQINKPKPQPLGYWEEQSYMIVVPKNNDADVIDGIFDRIAAIKGLTIKQKQNFNAEQRIVGNAVVDYQGEEYNISFFYDNFDGQSLYAANMRSLSENELQSVKNAKMALTVFMTFNDNPIKSYHLQIKFILAAIPELAAVYDESAEWVISGRQARLYAQSDVLPPLSALYSIQAVGEEGGDIWLHTHGLCRCGLTELEVIKSSSEYANDHVHIINALADRLLEKNGEGDVYYIGKIGDDIPIVVTYVLWSEALEEYNNPVLGGYSDRENDHNSRTSLIFAFKNERDESLRNYSKLDIYDGLWESGNPMFFISNKETERMRAAAEERFDYLKRAWETLDCQVLIKIGLNVDEKYKEEAGEAGREHIWFELIDMKENSFTARLTQKAYWVDDIHEGDIKEFTVNDVTDWCIYTENFRITPDTVYLLFDD